MGAPAHSVVLSGSSEAVRSTHGTYCGFTLRELAGAAAEIRIHDGTSATGVLLDTVALTADESAREFYHPGIRVSNGIYVEVVSGSVEGSIRIG